MHLRRSLMTVMAAGLLLGGCAVSREEIDLRVAASDNPSAGQAFKISEVIDRRGFELAPAQPSTPSLKDGEITDKAITSRAVARKRNSYGAALGDYLLPEGRTVMQLTAEALTKSLRDKGYRVVRDGEPGAETAIPLQADINQFWAWFSPGFAQVTIEFEARVTLRGNWPLSGSNTVTGSGKQGTIAATTSQWMIAFNAGIEDLVRNTRSALREPGVRVSALQD